MSEATVRDDRVRPRVEGGTFALVLEVPREQVVDVGALGSIRFPAGAYAYAGDARRGLGKVVDRLVAGGSNRRRHVDRLAGLDAARHAHAHPGAPAACELATHLARVPDALPVLEFGATGCPCLTHLHGIPGGDAGSFLEAARGWEAPEVGDVASADA